MKKIDPLLNNDLRELAELSKNNRLSSYPDLGLNKRLIYQQYKNYINHNGNPWFVSSCLLPDDLKAALKLHYSSPPKDRLKFIKIYREDLSPDICPMCGKEGTGELDHYLPKKEYSEFSFFSKNLVPACSCNSKRRTTVKGKVNPDRVIHPYFDDFIVDRLYQALFTGGFKNPSITVDIIDPHHPQIEILKFHLSEVVLKNNIENWLDKRWGALYSRPHVLLNAFLPTGNIDRSNLSNSILKMVQMKDDEYETPNSWWSIFYYGLSSDAGRLDLLANRINLLRI